MLDFRQQENIFRILSYKLRDSCRRFVTQFFKKFPGKNHVIWHNILVVSARGERNNAPSVREDSSYLELLK